MTGVSRAAWRSGGAAVRRHLEIPLYRNAYWLVSSSVGTAALGAVYWLVAARLFSAEAVGLGGAAISAMAFLSGVASLNLFNGLNRFAPRAGERTARLVTGSLTVAAALGLVTGVVFLWGVDLWSPTLGYLRETWWLAVWFPVAVAVWTVFTVEDGALTGVRASVWVAGSNLAHATAKILVLVAVAASLPQAGVFVAWTVPVVPVVAAVTVVLFSRLIPVHRLGVGGEPERVGAATVARFVAGDYSASLLWMATTNLLPVVVLERRGAEAAGHFYLGWTVAYVLYLVGRNMSMSLLTESTLRPDDALSLVYRTMRQAALLVVPAALVVTATAPLVMSLFGEGYAAEGAGLLRLLALGTIPSIVTTAYLAYLRLLQRMRALFSVMLALTAQVLALSWLLLGRGIAGVGVAWLVAHTVTAVWVLATDLRPALARSVRHDRRWSEP